MASNFTGVALAQADGANYKKVRMFWNNTAGLDLSNGGYFVQLSGHGVVKSAGSADVYGIVVNGPIASAGSTYVDVYNGLQDKFTAIFSSVAGIETSAHVVGANLYVKGDAKTVSTGTAGLDIVGTIIDSYDLGNNPAAITDGGRVSFQLTPSEAIAGYDSGNTT